MTVVHITHYMEEATQADRVIVMDHGKVVMEGTPREVFSEKEKLISMGLSLPPAGMMGMELSDLVKDFSTEALSVEELAEDIRKYKNHP